MEHLNRLLRLKQIIGDTESNPPIEPIIPVSSSSWWAGIDEGIFPSPVRLGKRMVAWRLSDIQAMINNLQPMEVDVE